MRIVASTLLLFALGCASTGQGESEPYDRHLLTLEEIQATTESNAYDIIRMLRPAWLRVRPSTFSRPDPVRVYLDGTVRSNLGELRLIPRGDIQEIRFYDAASAQARFGMNNTNGAISIITRRG